MQGGKSTESSYNVKIELENIQSQAKRSRSKVGYDQRRRWYDYLVDKWWKCELINERTDKVSG